MVLSKSNINFFLYHQQILTDYEFQQSPREIIEKKTKNLCFFIKYSNGKYYFIKQQLQYGEYDTQMFQQEVLFYKRVSTMSDLIKLQIFLPNYIGHNLSNNILILELLEDYWDLERTDIDDDKAVQVIQFLKIMSNISLGDADKTNIPWIFNFNSFNHSQNPILTLVAQNNNLSQTLTDLISFWQPNCLIHNDIKLNNILINNDQKIKVIDWEMVSIGDSYWDLACFVQSLYFYKIFSSSDIIKSKPLSDFLNFKALTSIYQENWSEVQKEKLIKFIGASIILRGSAIVDSFPSERFYHMITQLGTSFLLNPQQYFNSFFS
jgi:serine/threonine protein kinase